MSRLCRTLICGIFIFSATTDGLCTTATDSLYQTALALPDSLPIKTRIKAFKRVIKRNFKYAPAHNQLAWLYLKQNKPETRQSARLAINRALEVDPNNLNYQLTKGALIWSLGQYQNAVAFYKDILQRHPNCFDAAYWLGYYYTIEFLDNKDRLETSQPAGSAGFDMSSRSRDATLTRLESRARAAGFEPIDFTPFALENRDRALKYLGKTLEIRPQFRDAFYQIGLIHLESGRPERLVAAMQYLLDSQPYDKDALLFCGLGYLAQGLPGRANQYFTKALTHMSPTERTMLEDLTLIASKAERMRLVSAHPLETWTDTPGHTEFWRKQDPLFLTQYNERRLEHYARHAYANLRFSQPRANIEGWSTHTGQTYIKFGRYRQRIVRGDQHGLGETWFYEGFHLSFRSTPRGGLGGRIFNWQSGYAPPMARPMMRDPWWFVDHSDAPRAREIADGPSHVYISEIPLPPSVREVFKKTPQRYIDPYKKQRYSLPHLIAAFQERDSVRLEIAYAVPKRRARALVDGNTGIIDGVFLFDRTWNETYRNSTLVTRSTNESSSQTADSLSNDYINVQHTLRIKPGQYHVAAEVLDRQSWAIGSFREPHTFAPPTHQFSMSDLLLATQIVPQTAFPKTRNDLNIAPNPLKTFHSSESIYIYLELYNLKRNTFGRTKYEIAYRIGRPDDKEIDPSLFVDLDLPEDEVEIQMVDQPQSQQEETDLAGEPISTPRQTSPTYEVTYNLPKRNLVSEWIKKNVRGLLQKQHETTITAQYEGDRTTDFTYLQIDKPGH